MKRKIGIGQIISIIGTLILSAGLFCNGFEFISNALFRVIVLIGVIAQAIALFLIFKRNEF